MSMSLLERRVQILVDAELYAQVEREAVRTGRSVAAVIREAIAVRLASSDSVRGAAAQRLLASADPTSAAGEDWEQAKDAMRHELTTKLR
jgi:hypothetical protein